MGLWTEDVSLCLDHSRKSLLLSSFCLSPRTRVWKRQGGGGEHHWKQSRTQRIFVNILLRPGARLARDTAILDTADCNKNNTGPSRLYLQWVPKDLKSHDFKAYQGQEGPCPTRYSELMACDCLSQHP